VEFFEQNQLRHPSCKHTEKRERQPPTTKPTTKRTYSNNDLGGGHEKLGTTTAAAPGKEEHGSGVGYMLNAGTIIVGLVTRAASAMA
jgi:hypothetical protein